MDHAAKVEVVPPDKAALYLFRPNSFYGQAVLSELVVDGESRTNLGSGNYAFRLVKPGKHAIVVNCRCGTPSQMTLPTEPGKAYFISIAADFWRMPGDPTYKLTQLPPGKGRAALRELHLVEWNP